jgi:hypothetical protein
LGEQISHGRGEAMGGSIIMEAIRRGRQDMGREANGAERRTTGGERREGSSGGHGEESRGEERERGP